MTNLDGGGSGQAQRQQNVDNDKHLVTIYGIQILDTYFPDLDPATSAKMGQLLRSFIPPVVNISLERVVAYVPKPQQSVTNTVNLKNDPPFIFVSYTPAVLLAVDGQPVLADIPDTKLKFVVNTHGPIFFDTRQSQYFLIVGDRWLASFDLHGPWSVVNQLPKRYGQGSH